MTGDYTQGIVSPSTLSEGGMTGSELRAIRERLGLTQVEMAERLGVAANTVARWERDEKPIRPPVEKLIRLTAQSAGKRKGKG